MVDRNSESGEGTMSTITSTVVLKDYPYYSAETLEDVKEQLRLITNTRKDDISTISQITSSFISGRRVGKIPSSSIDVEVTDKVGDVNYDADYFYILIDDSGTPAWRRIALATW